MNSLHFFISIFYYFGHLFINVIILWLVAVAPDLSSGQWTKALVAVYCLTFNGRLVQL